MPVIGFKTIPRANGNSIQGGGFYGVFDGQSIEGGGYYGVFDGQSIQGGGSVSGVAISFGYGNNTCKIATTMAFFVKVATLPVSDMILCDLNAGATGYFRTKMTSAGHIVAETQYGSTAHSVDLTPTTACLTGVWYWVSVAAGNTTNFSSYSQLYGQVWKGDGTTQGQQGSDFSTVVDGCNSPSAVLGWGVSLSNGGGYLNFPNSSGNELSKLELRSYNASGGLQIPTPPTADVSTSGLIALYLCRGTVGSSVCNDSTVNAYNLTAGSNGMTVVVDGPY